MTKINYKNVLVVGGTGFLGSKIALALLAYGFKTSILVRKESLEKPVTKELKKRGFDIVEGDLSKPETLKDAVAPFEAVVSSTLMPEHEFGLIEALKSSKELKVYIPSLWIPKIPKEQPNILEAAKQKMVDATLEGKLPHIFVYIAFFLDSPKFIGIDVPNGKVDVHGDGNQQISSIHTDDVGLLMPHVLNETSLLNKEVYLETCRFSTNEAIQVIEKEGKKLEKRNVSEKDLDEVIATGFNPFNFFVVFNNQYKKQLYFSSVFDLESDNKKLWKDLKYKLPEEYFINLVHGKESFYKEFNEVKV